MGKRPCSKTHLELRQPTWNGCEQLEQGSPPEADGGESRRLTQHSISHAKSRVHPRPHRATTSSTSPGSCSSSRLTTTCYGQNDSCIVDVPKLPNVEPTIRNLHRQWCCRHHYLNQREKSCVNHRTKLAISDAHTYVELPNCHEDWFNNTVPMILNTPQMDPNMNRSNSKARFL